MRDRQQRGRFGPARALASVLGGALIVLAAGAGPALAADPSATATAPATSSPSSSPSLGIGSAISTSRRPPASAMATLGVGAASGSAAPIESASSVPVLLPTGVNAGHGTRTRVPLLSEIGAAVGVASLMLAFVLYYRRRPGSHF